MSTRCYIGYLQEDNKVRYVYCQFDGYVDWVGKLLHEWFTTDSSVVPLVEEPGDIRAINPHHAGSGCRVERYPDNPHEHALECNAKDYIPENPVMSVAEYLYLWDGKKWWVRSGYLPILLTVKDALTLSSEGPL